MFSSAIVIPGIKAFIARLDDLALSQIRCVIDEIIARLSVGIEFKLSSEIGLGSRYKKPFVFFATEVYCFVNIMECLTGIKK
jgi:hypothetical protein